MVRTCEAQVLDGGHLSVAEDVLNEMNLQRGERVEVTIRRFSEDELDDLSDNPLAEMIGMCGNIGKTDSSVNHDYYLYVEDNP